MSIKGTSSIKRLIIETNDMAVMYCLGSLQYYAERMHPGNLGDLQMREEEVWTSGLRRVRMVFSSELSRAAFIEAAQRVLVRDTWRFEIEETETKL